MKPQQSVTPAEYMELLRAQWSEEQFQQAVIERAQLLGWTVAHFGTVRVQRANGSVYYQTPARADGAGFPDLVMIRGHRQLVAELKVKNNKPTERQMLWLTLFSGTGAEMHVWYPRDWEEIVKTLEEP